jgi:hypothetical protein
MGQVLGKGVQDRGIVAVTFELDEAPVGDPVDNCPIANAQGLYRTPEVPFWIQNSARRNNPDNPKHAIADTAFRTQASGLSLPKPEWGVWTSFNLQV